MNTEWDRLIGLTEAANLLQELHICKAFGPTGRINGPNCQRFGRRDPESGRWHWSVAELVREAEKRGCATATEIKIIIAKYSINKPEPLVKGPRPGRARLEKDFWDIVRELESALKALLPSRSLDQYGLTFGKLIHRCKDIGVLEKPTLAEALFVNDVRNSLAHPDVGEVRDDQLVRASQSASALCAKVRTTSGSKP